MPDGGPCWWSKADLCSACDPVEIVNMKSDLKEKHALACADDRVESFMASNGPRRYCSTCNNTGEVDCHCGGDLCVCGDEVLPCPDCGGDFVSESDEVFYGEEPVR